MATAQPQPRTYEQGEVVSFRKTREAFGGLSNMAAGYPLLVEGVRIGTSEALYQACRFPHLPEIQRLIIAESSPMTAKMRSKPYRGNSRDDWDNVRIPIMKWCLRVKLAQNWNKFGQLLLETGDRPIVEDSSRDDFWGAIRGEPGIFNGRNVLGRLLMDLRERLRTDPESLQEVAPVAIPDFLLFGRQIFLVQATRIKTVRDTPPLQSALGFAETVGLPASDGSPPVNPILEIAGQERQPPAIQVEPRMKETRSPFVKGPAAEPVPERSANRLRWKALIVASAAAAACLLLWQVLT